MMMINDPTYDQSKIQTNPVWRLAFSLSEILNAVAPLGWSRYIFTAECLLAKYDIRPASSPLRDTKLDAKFYGEIRKVKDDSIVPDDEYVVFLAKDNAFAEILPMYLNACRGLGCDREQIHAVLRMMGRLYEWREQHPERLKDPDAAGEKLLDKKDGQ